jgi:hypothetical protein
LGHNGAAHARVADRIVRQFITSEPPRMERAPLRPVWRTMHYESLLA